MIDIDTLIAQIESTAWHLHQRGEDAVIEYLDRRDEAPFDSDWTQAHGSILAHKRGVAPESVQAIDAQARQVSEAAFVKVFRVSHSDDLAGYMADDAVLIFEADRFGIDSPWVAALYRRYDRHAAPFGALLENS